MTKVCNKIQKKKGEHMILYMDPKFDIKRRMLEYKAFIVLKDRIEIFAHLILVNIYLKINNQIGNKIEKHYYWTNLC